MASSSCLQCPGVVYVLLIFSLSLTSFITTTMQQQLWSHKILNVNWQRQIGKTTQQQHESVGLRRLALVNFHSDAIQPTLAQFDDLTYWICGLLLWCRSLMYGENVSWTRASLFFSGIFPILRIHSHVTLLFTADFHPYQIWKAHKFGIRRQ